MVESPINESIILLIVGMITVFTVLLLIVITANILIRVINRIQPNRYLSGKPNQHINKMDERIIESAIKEWSADQASIKSIKNV